VLINVAVIVGFFGVLFFFMKKSAQSDKESLVNNNKEVVGTVESIGKMNKLWWTFTDGSTNGRVFSGSSFEGLQMGERFWAIYDTTNPISGAIFLDRPYLADYNLDTTYDVKILNSDTDKIIRNIKFEYEANGRTYNRTLVLSENSKKERWLQAKQLMVVYKKERPEIGYLFPVED
jgi:hypothetical protein